MSCAPFEEEAVGGSTLNGLGVRFGPECLEALEIDHGSKPTSLTAQSSTGAFLLFGRKRVRPQKWSREKTTRLRPVGNGSLSSLMGAVSFGDLDTQN